MGRRKDKDKERKTYGLNEVYALLPHDHPTRSLKKARRQLTRIMAGDGGDCPCCGRWTKVNPFPLTAIMVKKLIWITDESSRGRKWVDIPKVAGDWITNGNNHSTLAYWGLLQNQRAKKGAATKYSGFWKPTRKGVKFLLGRIKVPRTAWVYNKVILGHSYDFIQVDEARGRFNYWEVMRRTWMGEYMRQKGWDKKFR